MTGIHIELDERRRRLLKLAEERGDRLAIATLKPSKPWTPEDPDYAVTRLPSVGIGTTWRGVAAGLAIALPLASVLAGIRWAVVA